MTPTPTAIETVSDLFAVLMNGNWSIATAVPAAKFGVKDSEHSIWSEQDTTAWIGHVGKEEMAINLSRRSLDTADGVDESAHDLWRWIETYMAEECGHMPEYLSDAERSNIVNAIRNTLALRTPSEGEFKRVDGELSGYCYAEGPGDLRIRTNDNRLLDRILAALASPSPQPVAVAVADDDDRMRKISEVIADLQSIQERFGDTCVYIRRGGMSWGAVALNRRYDDKKNGVFDLQEQHDRDMVERAQQVQRLVEDNRELRERLSSLQPKE